MNGGRTVSDAQSHIYMVNKGFAHSDLNAMEERDFIALFEEQIAFDEARAEAEAEAIRKAGRT